MTSDASKSTLFVLLVSSITRRITLDRHEMNKWQSEDLVFVCACHIMVRNFKLQTWFCAHNIFFPRCNNNASSKNIPLVSTGFSGSQLIPVKDLHKTQCDIHEILHEQACHVSSRSELPRQSACEHLHHSWDALNTRSYSSIHQGRSCTTTHTHQGWRPNLTP